MRREGGCYPIVTPGLADVAGNEAAGGRPPSSEAAASRRPDQPPKNAATSGGTASMKARRSATRPSRIVYRSAKR